MDQLRFALAFFFVLLLDIFGAGVLGQATFSDSSSNVGLSLTTTSNGSATDLHLQLSGQTSDGWVAVGVGSGMVGAMMFIIYPNSAQDGVTVSVRSASSHVMPTPLSGINYAVQSSSISGGKMDADFICYGCTTWSSGSLDVTSTRQPWIYAIGPGSEVASDDDDATIQQHSNNGYFYVDMTTAAQSSSSSGTSTSPSSSSPTSGTSSSGVITGSSSSSSSLTNTLLLAHAGILIITFVALFPLGTILLRLPFSLAFNSHWMFQLTGTAAGLAGFGIAIAMSLKMGEPYNKFHYAHQILGLIVLSLLSFQALAGFLHHQTFKRTGKRSVVSYGHMLLGRALIIGGMVNAILGFRLKGKHNPQIIVGVISLLVLLAMEAVTAWSRTRRSRAARRTPWKYNHSPERPSETRQYGRGFQ